MKIGKFIVPNRNMRMRDSLQNTLKLYSEYKTNLIARPNNDDGIAQVFGYSSANNGSFVKSVAAIKDYGFLEKVSAGEFKVSNLAIDAQYGTKEEKRTALMTAFNNIPLWKQLYDSYKDKLPDDPIWLKLRNITGIQSDEAQKVESFVREAYLDDLAFVKENIGEFESEPKETDAGIGEEESTEAETHSEELFRNPNAIMITITIGTFKTVLPVNEIGFEAAKNFLESLKPHFLDRP